MMYTIISKLVFAKRKNYYLCFYILQRSINFCFDSRLSYTAQIVKYMIFFAFLNAVSIYSSFIFTCNNIGLLSTRLQDTTLYFSHSLYLNISQCPNSFITSAYWNIWTISKLYSPTNLYICYGVFVYTNFKKHLLV